jgi:glycine oxidase
MKQAKFYDAIVLGAGVAGLGAATALAEEGRKVLVVSKKNRGEASPASAGILDPFLEMRPGHPLFPLCLSSFKNYPAFLKKIRFTGAHAYEKTGMLYVAMNKREEALLKKRHTWQKKTPVPVKWISSQSILKEHPDVEPSLRSGLFYPTIGRVQPRRLLASWVRYAKKMGVKFVWTQNPAALKIKSGRVEGVSAGRDFYPSSCVINATGAWAGVKQKLGVRAPVLPARGQICMVRGKLRINTILHTLDGGYVVPWGRGKYLVGSNVEFCGFKPSVTPHGLRDILRRNQRVLPKLLHCKRFESWAGLRPFSEKHLPLIGPTRIKGLYLAAGYYRSGILISALAGKLLAKGIISGKMPPALKAFQPRKFGL